MDSKVNVLKRVGRFKRSRLAMACLGSTVLLTGCIFDDDVSPTVGGESNVSTPIQTSLPITSGLPIHLVVNNGANQDSVGGLDVSAQFQMEGQDTNVDISIIDSDGIVVAGYKDGGSYVSGDMKIPSSGFLPLTLKSDNLKKEDNSSATLSLVVSGDGFFSNAATYDLLSSDTSLQNRVEVLPKSTSSDFAGAFAEETVWLSGNVVTQQVVINTPIKPTSSLAGQILDNAQISIDIPANTEFFDSNGNPFEPTGAVKASAVLVSADPKNLSNSTNNPLFAFPGGLQVSGLEGATPSDLNNDSEFSFISAGFVAIEIKDSLGNQVSQFGGDGINLNFEVPKSTVHPNTSQPIKLEDGSIPLWSYNENTAKWSYEGEALITAENANTFSVVKKITHLSYYNLDWYGTNRCKLDVDVLDKDGQPNNQRLRLSYARKDGGWAYKPSGWGNDLDKLNIQRVPAFAGTFDLLDSIGNSLLASIEVDGQSIAVGTGEKGVNLDDFCFGKTNDASKSFTAHLNIKNPPRINLKPSVELVCPTDTTKTASANSGRYYLYEGYSYIQRGQVTNGELDLQNLTENAQYKLYYYGNNTRGRLEFTASDSLTSLQINDLSLCPTVNQTLHTRLVCLDSNQTVIKQKPAPLSRYWAYDESYSQYMQGSTNDNGNATLDKIVEGVNYYARAYLRENNRWYYGRLSTPFVGSSSQTATVDMKLRSTDSFCTTDEPVDYAQTELSGSATSANANGTEKVTITVQEKDQYGNSLGSNTGTLTLSASPSNGVTIENTQSNGDGTYTADVSSSVASNVVISGSIDGNAISDTASIDFVQALDVSQTVYTLSSTSVSANGSDEVTATVTLKDFEGQAFEPASGTVSFATTGTANGSGATHQGGGVYTEAFTSTTSGSVTITPRLDSTDLSSAQTVTFTAALDVSQTTLALSTNTVDADGTSTVTATVTLKDYAGQAFEPASGTVSLVTDGSVTSSAVTAQGDGVYVVTLTSTSAGSVTITPRLDSTDLSSAQTVTFTAALDVSQTTLALSTNSVDADGTSTVTATVTLKDYAGQAFVPASGTVSFTTTGTANGSGATHQGGGIYTEAFTSTTAGTVTITPKLDSIDLAAAQSVTFTSAGPDLAQSTITANSSATKVNNALQLTVTLKKADGSNYGQSGGTLALSSSPSGITESVVDNGDGTYTATINSSTATDYVITANVGGNNLTNTVSVAFTQVDVGNVEMTSNVTIPNGGSGQISVVLKQSDGSDVGHGGHTVAIATASSVFASAATTDNGDGSYALNVTCNLTGFTAPITVEVDNSSIGTFMLTCSS
ncbi:Ig-like domain-containing protein [Vibrio penaeicida]|uniref:Big-1 domain-containing protein n=1 Tax=Vibrio penaeicida TaxID=104609 RepID=A0AAV5NXM0_9VIBR|nr:Ig-like domain-containing protein [Vibrio penaeicida]GLQ75042.1 hypothetical protein GCM10007932_44040 [Vibrio penaeicida]